MVRLFPICNARGPHSSCTCYFVLIVPGLPEPAGFYPLDGASKFTDITCKNPAGIASGLSLAPGPRDEPDGAYEFLGNAGSFIEIPRSGPLDTRYSITVMAWVLNQGSIGPIINYHRNDWGYHFWFTQPNQLYVHPKSGVAQAYTDSGLTGTWHFVGATYDHDSGGLRMVSFLIMNLPKLISERFRTCGFRLLRR